MIELRPLTPEDALEVATFYEEVRLQTVPILHSRLEVEAWLKRTIVPRESSWVHVREGEIVAWIDVQGSWLDQLYCRAGWTGQGLGKLLVDWAKQRSPQGLRLYTFQLNLRARRFYKREGFVEVEFGDGSGNEERAPDVLMEWAGGSGQLT